MKKDRFISKNMKKAFLKSFDNNTPRRSVEVLNTQKDKEQNTGKDSATGQTGFRQTKDSVPPSDNFCLGDRIISQGLQYLYLDVNNVEEFIRLLLEYEDYKMELARNNDALSYEEKVVHIRCCIDTKIYIKKLVGEKLL